MPKFTPDTDRQLQRNPELDRSPQLNTSFSALSVQLDDMRAMRELNVLNPKEERKLQAIETEINQLQSDTERWFKQALGIDPNRSISPQDLQERLKRMSPETLEKLAQTVVKDQTALEELTRRLGSDSPLQRATAIEFLADQMAQAITELPVSLEVAGILAADPSISPSMRAHYAALVNRLIQTADTLNRFFLDVMRRLGSEEVFKRLEYEDYTLKNNDPTKVPYHLLRNNETSSKKFGLTPEDIIYAVSKGVVDQYHAREAEKIEAQIKMLHADIRSIKDSIAQRSGRDNTFFQYRIGALEREIELKEEAMKYHLELHGRRAVA
ncbi:MAG: hypothetical protein J5J00_00950 [Deltaproteobacteria bacterium]|nr:hypothetical protein [Deltaproteobacteria bacterium]